MVWLFWLDLAVEDENELRWGLLFIGGVAILTGNLVGVFSVDRSIAFKGLVSGLWLFGLWVYSHDGQSFQWYYGSIAAVITIFVLLLAFRRDRLVKRAEREEADTLWLYQRIDRIVERHYLATARKYLKKLVTSWRTKDLQRAYRGLKRCLPADERGDEVRIKMSILASSKQQGANLGEFLAIAILGFVAVCGLLFFLPVLPECIRSEPDCLESRGWIGLFAEMSAVLISASIVFLFCNLWDLQRERRFSLMDKNGRDLSFRRADRRRAEVLIAFVASALIVLTYGSLLWYQWLVERVTGAILARTYRAFQKCWQGVLKDTSAWAWDVAHLPELTCSLEYQALLAALASVN